MLREKRRIAFFGGTFDPFHCGHLEMARAAVSALRLHQLNFVPALQSPLKSQAPLAPAADRLAMLRLGIGREGPFGIWEAELSRPAPSYTLHSVQHIERVYPNCHLFWIIGADQLADLPRWHGIAELVRRIGFIVLRRPGHELAWPGLPGLIVYLVDNPLNPISATEVRERVRAGLPLDGWVPPAVAAYIAAHGLYR